MSEKCKRCGSYAINPHCHDREPEKDLDLCDVCYWRKRVESARDTLLSVYVDLSRLEGKIGMQHLSQGDDL